MKDEVELNDKVQIACLPTKEDGLDDSFLDGKTLITSGWGHLRSGGGVCPNELHAVALPGYSNERCRNETGYDEKYGWDTMEEDRVNSMLCAGEKGKDACQGDSGGNKAFFDVFTAESKY